MEDTSYAKRCQTCYVTFDSIEALQAHHWRYQVRVYTILDVQSLIILLQAEVNWHSTRIQEAQLHLPPRQHRISLRAPYHQACENCAGRPHFENNTSEEENTPHDDGINHNGRCDRDHNSYESAGQERSFSCPAEKCEKTFTRIARLLPHFGQRMSSL
jgi:hypothetical protein